LNLFQGVIACICGAMVYASFGFMVASAITHDGLWMNVAIGSQISASLVGMALLFQNFKQNRKKT